MSHCFNNDDLRRYVIAVDDSEHADSQRLEVLETAPECLAAQRLRREPSQDHIHRPAVDLRESVTILLGLAGKKDLRQTYASCGT